MKSELEILREQVKTLQQWVDDLHSGMYVNCVYCGHRYGPAQSTPATMADTLKQHIARCEKHPMAMLLRACRCAYHTLSSIKAVREGITDDTLQNHINFIREAINSVCSEEDAISETPSFFTMMEDKTNG